MIGFWGRRLTERVRFTWRLLRNAYVQQNVHAISKRLRFGPTRQMLIAVSYAAASTSTDRPAVEQKSDRLTADLFAKTPESTPDSKWEKIIHDSDLSVYRRWLGDLGVYEYRCAGTYDDISAEDFVRSQADLEYRKQWDVSVVKLQVLKVLEDGTEVIKWVHKFPRPMSARIYIYRRQFQFDEHSQTMQIDSEGLSAREWADDPADKGVVRVDVYKSRLSVRAHSSYTSNGLDYVLTYSDHPKAAIPGPAYNWILNYGGPYFLKQVYAAAKSLSERKRLTGSAV
ncbi:START domain-containing protein [Aphelenchoides fujianensis]|nr:START domain-containing protein [Aphelenchoides fujianensis]